MFLKLSFAVSLSVLFFTIQYAVFRKSIRTFYLSLYIYIYIYIYTHMYIYINIYIYILSICTFLTKAACCRNMEI